MANRSKFSRKKSSPILWMGIALVVLIAGVLGVQAYNRAYGIVKSPDDVERISAAATIKAVESGKAILLDNRAETLYLAQHAKGALSFPRTDVPARVTELDPKQYYITYCT